MERPPNAQLAEDLEPGWHFCHVCLRYTQWVYLRRGSKRQRCSVCSDQFPCRGKCSHQDCRDFHKQHRQAAA